MAVEITILLLLGLAIFIFIVIAALRRRNDKRKTHHIVEYRWHSNVKTVDTIQRGCTIKHEVLPDNSQDNYFSVQPYKKKKR